MTEQLSLYSTSHCHLCELAYALAMKVPNISVSVIDIAEDELLLAKYGVHIPVLQRQDTEMQLNWPFTEADIHQLLK
jgi:hypothetical protein